MADKPIIIDGIDISKCECSSQIDLDVNIICTSNFPSKKSGYCKDNTNCLYKQLARKTQECEEWKLQATSLSYADTICALEIDLQHKTQECEELKGRLKYIRDENIYLKESATDEQLDFVALNNYIKTLEFQLDQLKAENWELKRKLMQHEKDIKDLNYCAIKFKQTLTEIKEIAEEKAKVNDWLALEILQIIDEVE